MVVDGQRLDRLSRGEGGGGEGEEVGDGEGRRILGEVERGGRLREDERGEEDDGEGGESHGPSVWVLLCWLQAGRCGGWVVAVLRRGHVRVLDDEMSSLSGTSC